MRAKYVKKDWKEQLKCKLLEELSILSKSKSLEEEVTDSIVNSYDFKTGDINISTFISAYKPDNQNSRAIITMAMYLWEYEVRFGFCINALAFILISNGHDLYDEYSKTYAATFEDIESIDIARKCKFLAHHGFEMFDENRNKEIKLFRTMRNNVAHHKLLMSANGTIKMYNKEEKEWLEVPLIVVHGNLMEFVNGILLILWNCIFPSK